MKWLDKLFDWFMPVKQTADPHCTYCKGTGYDASGYTCTCVKEVR